MAPADFGLALRRFIRFCFAFLYFKFIEPGAQHVPGRRAIFMLPSALPGRRRLCLLADG